jgi:hypothetical protein
MASTTSTEAPLNARDRSQVTSHGSSHGRDLAESVQQVRSGWLIVEEVAVGHKSFADPNPSQQEDRGVLRRSQEQTGRQECGRGDYE